MFSLHQWVRVVPSGRLAQVVNVINAQGYTLYVVAIVGRVPLAGHETEGYFADELQASA